MTNSLDGTVSRIDARRSRIVGTIRTGRSPANITDAFGSVWIGSTTGTRVFRIDPATKAVASVEAGGEGPASIEAGVDAVWSRTGTATPSPGSIPRRTR